MDKEQYEKLKQQKLEQRKQTSKKPINKGFFALIIVAVLVGGGIYYLYSSYQKGVVDNNITLSSKKEIVKKLLATGHVYGAENPKVFLAEFSDFQCPVCGAYFPLVKQIKEEFKDDMAFVYMHFPLTRIHPNAEKAARASEAAAKQGKFWEMHDMIFERQKEWSGSLIPFSKFKEYAENIGLDVKKFEEDYNSEEVKNIVKEHINIGNSLNVSWTPSFFLQGKLLANNPRSAEEFKQLIENAKNNNPIKNISESSEDYHVHADIKVSIFGNEIDFSKDKYQSVEGKELSPWQHFHDGNGNVMHQHKKGLTLSDFFRSLGFVLTDECIEIPQDEAVLNPFSQTKETKFCTDAKNSLKLYANGNLLIDESSQKPIVGSYEIKDLDRLLILYDGSDLETINLDDFGVTNDACIYSEKCPERGEPPTESCVGGLGSKCE